MTDVDQPSLFHIYNRGANRAKIFSNRENYLFLRRRIKRYLEYYNVSIFAYCLMPNHYHFLLQETTAGDKSRFIQRLFNSYTQAYNRAHRRTGTLFESRMKAKIVSSERYALELVRYIHLNPVYAGLVEAPLHWAFSSHAEWLGWARQRICNLDLRSGFFPNRSDYLHFISAAV